MLFNSLSYAIFIPAAFILYWIMPKKLRWGILLLIGWFSCAMISKSALMVLICVSALGYLFGIFIDFGKSERMRKLFLVLGIIVLLSILVFFKYLTFLTDNLNSLIWLLWPEGETMPAFGRLEVFMPIGISFYMLQIIGYLIDVYRGTIPAETHPGYFALFASFFPQLVSGPIGRAGKLLPQYREPVSFKDADIAYGLKLMAWGYFKKLCIADVLAVTVDTVFGAPEQYVGLIFPVVVVMYTIELYCDFSGYSDIAVGTAMLFGIRLDVNFRSPYFSRSVREFWSRWHISLSTWFRDYLYIPLGGSRRGKARRVLNLMITMLVSGLWHGAAWTFVFWGGLHGIYQSAEVLLSGVVKKKELTKEQKEEEEARFSVSRLLHTLLTFVLVSFAWLFFRADSMAVAWRFISKTLHGADDIINYLKTFVICSGMTYLDMVWTIIPVMILAVCDRVSKDSDIAQVTSRLKAPVRYTLYVLLLVAIFIFSAKGVQTEFIYGTF